MPSSTPAHRRARSSLVSTERPGTRRVLLAALAGVVVLAVVGGLLIRHALGGARSAGTLPASAVSSPSAAATPPGANAVVNASIDTAVNVGTNRVMNVTQHVRLDRLVNKLRLAVPKRTTRVSGGEFAPRVRNLRIVLSNHSPLTLHMTVKPGNHFTVALPRPVTTFDVVYAARGAVRRSEPSSAHRALALVTLVTVALADHVTNTIRFHGANVTNLGCIEPSGAAIPCGSQTTHGWSATQSPSQQDLTIVAQLDLQS